LSLSFQDLLLQLELLFVLFGFLSPLSLDEDVAIASHHSAKGCSLSVVVSDDIYLGEEEERWPFWRGDGRPESANLPDSTR